MRRKILVYAISSLDPAATGAPGVPGATGAPPGLPSVMVDPTDIVALVLMALFTIHRIEVKGTDARAFPEVRREDFDDWQRKAISARQVLVNACFAKAFLNNLVFYGLRSFLSASTVWTFGRVLFFGWVAALAYGLWASSASNRRARQLGIVIGRKVIEEKAPREDAGV